MELVDSKPFRDFIANDSIMMAVQDYMIPHRDYIGRLSGIILPDETMGPNEF